MGVTVECVPARGWRDPGFAVERVPVRACACCRFRRSGVAGHRRVVLGCRGWRARRWQSHRLAEGAGRVSIFKAITVLGAILQRALEAERIARNPARLVRKVRRPSKTEVRPLAPNTVEAMRAAAEPRDAALISVLAYAGLRPQEALALRWRDVGERTLLVNAQKTGQRRNVRLLAPLREDLNAWRGSQGKPDKDALVFPGHDGERLAVDAYKSWSRKAPRGRRHKGKTQRSGSPGPFARATIAGRAPTRRRTRSGIRSARCCCTRAVR